MKLIAAFIFFSLVGLRVAGQYISEGAHRKMMCDFYNYTLLGSQTPTTGFKVDIAKPSISLKGNLISNRDRRIITNLEIEGGFDNGLMQLFSGNKASSYFKGVLGFNFLIDDGEQRHLEGLSRAELQLTANAIRQHSRKILQHLDTFAVIKIMTDDREFRGYSFDELVEVVIAERDLPKYSLSSYSISENEAEKTKRFREITRQVIVNYIADTAEQRNFRRDSVNHNAVLKYFKDHIVDPDDVAIKTKSFLNDYDRIKELLLKKEKRNLTLNEYLHDFEIALTKVNWPVKKIWWVNASLTATQNSFRLYDGFKKITQDSSSFLPALSFSINHFRKHEQPSRFYFIRAGIKFQKTNSIVDLVKYNYKNVTKIAISQTEELTKTDEGIAYEGSLKEAFGFEVFAETFLQPFEFNGIPGLYMKTMFTKSEAWINKSKIPLDLGLLWNVTNNDKDAKNLLTIIPYISWSSVLNEYKDVNKSVEKQPKDKITVGIRFGIPVNIGK